MGKIIDDIEVIKKIKKGDTEAFALLVEKYHGKLLNFIFKLVGNEDIVEDLGQEIFLSLYKSLKTFDGKREVPISAWLFILARNRCISELRKKQHHKVIILENIDQIASNDKTAEDIIMEQEHRHVLEISLTQLDEPYRCTILKSLEGDSIKEIAIGEKVSSGTIKSRLFRAREKVKAFLKQYYKEKNYERV